MRFDVAFPGNHHIPGTAEWSWTASPADRQRMVREIDDLGFDAISVSEHFAMPYFELPRLGAYWMHALSVLAFVAGATRRVRLEATVLVLPYHHPLALAKALATIDVLSGGRLNVSVGVGHAVREFEVLGVPFSERGARADEILDAMNVLWTSDEPVFRGRFYDIDGLAFEPKPVQQPRPPIYIGGNSKPALRRAARHDGWQPNPTNFSIDEVPPLLDYIRSQPEFEGKEKTFDLFWLPFPGTGPALPFKTASASDLASYRDRVLEGVRRLDEIGVTRTSVPVPASSSVDEYLDALRWFAQEVAPHAGH